MSALFTHNESCWYLVRTKPRQEFRALAQLENQKYNCFLPIMERTRCAVNKTWIAVEPLFSQYLFVRPGHASQTLFHVSSTRGVSELVTFGGRYATLPDECIEALRQAQARPKVNTFERGERVSVIAGPFAGLEGVYQMSDGDARALVMLEVMCRMQPLKLPVEALHKAE